MTDASLFPLPILAAIRRASFRIIRDGDAAIAATALVTGFSSPLPALRMEAANA